MKQYLKYWCSPGYPGDPSNDPSNDPPDHTLAAVELAYRASSADEGRSKTPQTCICARSLLMHKFRTGQRAMGKQMEKWCNAFVNELKILWHIMISRYV